MLIIEARSLHGVDGFIVVWSGVAPTSTWEKNDVNCDRMI